LRKFGAELTVINSEPDGNNINDGCGSQHPEAMCASVIKTGARLGIAHDGDADRVILCDEKGEILDGDEILAILAARFLADDRLNKRTLVATQQSNLGLRKFMEDAGGKLETTDIGDRHVIARMLTGGFNLGGESSGHIICSDIQPCGDGLVAALLILEAMLASGKPLSELRRGLTKFPQLSRALRVASKPDISTLSALPAAIAQAGKQLGDSGRILVRYSGTEPKIRLLVEGPDETMVTTIMSDLESAVRTDLPET
jgi:phosphoglucosamine mutase